MASRKNIFIDEAEIVSALSDPAAADPGKQRASIEKALAGGRLGLGDTAALLAIRDGELRHRLFEAAGAIKQRIYGNRLVFFAPLYLTNRCTNNCLYCAFRRDNRELVRATLTREEIRRETETLIRQGHKRLLLVCGEHPKEASLDYVGESILAVYGVNIGGNNIRRVNVNIAPLAAEEFRRLKSFGIGTYQCFQETYHRATYAAVHPSGRKKDYAWRLFAMDRAIEAGIDDVGIGALFGLYDYRFETLALLRHASHLEETFGGVGPHTISIPRLEPAFHAPLSSANSPWSVPDEEFKQVVAVLRLAVPYTGIILSTRENAQMRRELFGLGVSQLSAGSRTDPGGYLREDHRTAEQFQLGDTRPLEEVVRDILSLGCMPSFCTACYRSGRTGERFMRMAKSGTIGSICEPNALATFEEYLVDCAGVATREEGRETIRAELQRMENGRRERTEEMIRGIDEGERDVFL